MVAHVTSFFMPRLRTFAPAAPVDDSSDPVDPVRERLVDSIQSLNPTATRSFLVEFRIKALKLYLEHLASTVREPRGRTAVWIRPGDTPGIVRRLRRD